MSTDNVLTLINPLLMWEQGRNFLQEQPGYISTALHQSITDDARFRLINVAKWESAETYMAATKKMRASPDIPKVEGLIPNPALYTVIRDD